jgi:tellurite resistance protein TehA-like permease
VSASPIPRPADAISFREHADLSPGYFGMVMATGIVSLAADIAGLAALARAMFWLNIVAYAVLWTLNVLRAVRHTRRFAADVIDHLRGPGFFTTVAATGVLGIQALLLAHDRAAAIVLWIGAGVLWIVVTYTIFAGMTVKARKPSLPEGINGGWLLAVVATQSIAVLGALLAPQLSPRVELAMHFLALSMWLWGGMLYIWTMSLIFYRYLFFPLAPGELAPPYWINMGAMAISALAGSLMIDNVGDAPFLASMLPFIKGFTVFYWATGTWWIPMLLVLGVWRYVVKRFPLAYDPMYWGAVFPLGMYTVSTHDLAVAMQLDFLEWIPEVSFWIALVAWAATFAGLLHDLARRARAMRA